MARSARSAANASVLERLEAIVGRQGLLTDKNDLEPYLGLDPVIERTGEQLPLFGG